MVDMDSDRVPVALLGGLDHPPDARAIPLALFDSANSRSGIDWVVSSIGGLLRAAGLHFW